MNLRFIVVLLPALALARIDVEIHKNFEDDLRVVLSGHIADVISDIEINSFQISSRDLKFGVKDYMGKQPDAVYLKSPTPFGDLYKTYGWKQVTRTLVPRSSRVLSMAIEPVVITEKNFKNDRSKRASYNVGMSQRVENTMNITWDYDDELSVNEDLNIAITNEIDQDGNSETLLSFESPWGDDEEVSEKVRIGDSNFQILLEPGQSGTAQLIAYNVSMRVEIEYEASLSGDVIAYYAIPHKEQRYWPISVGQIMEKIYSPNSLKSSQLIEIDYYEISKILAVDDETGEELLEVYFNNQPIERK